MRRPITVAVAALACTLVLSGCSLLSSVLQPRPPQATPIMPDGTTSGEAPAGWAEFEPCDPSDTWVWVDGYPAAAMEAAGLVGECGGTYFDRGDLPTYVSAADLTVTRDQLEALRGEVEALGFAETDSTFVEPGAGSEAGEPGSWQYELNLGDPDAYEAIYLLTYWHGDQPATFDTYVDYESPGTRVLQK